MRSDQSQEIHNLFAAAHLRKFMSIVLTVCMILTVMPVDYAAAETVTETKDVTSADVTISDASKNYIITGGTQETPAKHSVAVNAGLGTVNITLKDTYIVFQDAAPVACAFNIGAGTTVNLTLSGNSQLVSNGTFAGLHVPENAVLNITAPDTGSLLSAQGAGSGAGIGGNSGESCGKVTIANGTVEGIGVTAAGIGGGMNGGAGDLTITGGRVSGQTYAEGAPDIGCGKGGSGGKVTVSGGFVHAERNLMIGGGTGTVNTFTGGSICANTVTPTPTDGAQNVYRTLIELPYTDNNTVITYKVGNGSTCSADGGSSNLYYLWLPQNDKTAVTITGTDKTKTYKAGGSVYAGNNNTLEFYKDLAITAQPASETTVAKKAAASLTVTADGSNPSYEWYQNTSQSTEGGTLATGSDGWNASTLTLPTDVVGTKYYYCVVKSTLGGFSDTKTTNIVKVTVTPNTETPYISPSMYSQSALLGKTATFKTEATVSDGGTLSYKWQKSTASSGPWTDVTTGTGYDTAEYTTAPATAADNGTWYQCVVTNTCDGESKSATSPNASLTVIADTPQIESLQVSATSFIPGQKADFSTTATVTDGGTLTYQWYIKGKNDTTWTAIDGATGSGSSPLTCKYTTDALTALQDGGRYYCKVTNNCQGLTRENYSNTTGIAVGAPSFYIQTQPKDAIKNAGETASFSITHSMPSAGTVTYQWEYSTDGYTWDAVTAGTGGTTANYTTAALTSGDTGTQYRCVATNTLDGAKFIVNSNAATLKIQAATPTINPQPKDAAADIGATATYTVTASVADGGTLSYQWQCKTSGGDWANVAAGGTDVSYTTGTLTASDDGAQYRCVVTNSKNETTATATSDAAALKLNTAKPEINPQPKNLTGYIGSTATFTIGATAADGGVLSYQWEKSTDGSSWSPVTGGTGGQTASYTTGTLAYADNGTKYRCVVTNTKNGTATVTSDAAALTVQAAAPVIVNQPKSAVKNIGDKAEFSVFATVGHGTLSYQWEKSTDGLSWNPVTGGTGGQTASYTTDALAASDTGTKYRCVVTNSDDGAQTKTTSNAAALNIQAATPTINPQPKDTAADIGAAATFTVGAAAADGGTLTYQWQKSVSGTWTDIEGAKDAGYTTGTLTASDDGTQYRCVVTNSKNETTATANSNAAALKLNTAKPTISPQPKDSSADIGETATFTVGAAAADGGTLSYQWEKSTDGGLHWNSVTGGTGGQTASYTTGTLAYADNGTKYRCVVTNTKNGTSAAVTSNAATLTVNPVAAPKGGIDCDAPVYAGQTAKITVTASVTDGGTLSYQWQKSVNGTWADIAGAKDAVYTTGTLAASDNGAKYRCIVTNSNNGATKNITLETTLSVLDAAVPVITQQPANATKDSGATAAFTVTAETADGGTLSYQWEKSTDGGSTWTAVSAGTGANSASYTTDALTVSDNNTLFRCAVTSKNISSGKTKTVTSDPASLTVGILEAPVFTAQPENATKDSGETATFTAEASVTGGGTVTYQWQISFNGKDWSNISGATGESYTTGKLAVSDSGTKYRCVAVNKKDGASAKTVSSVAVLTVVKTPDKPLDKVITSFVDLVPSVQTRRVSNGTTFASLSLPKKLEAVANEISGVWVKVKNWACNVTFDPTAAGTYVFTPEIELDSGYVLDSGAALPEITVTVGEKSHSSGSSSSSKGNTALPAAVTAASTGTTVDLSGATLPAGVTGLTFETSVKGTAEKETIAVDKIFNADKKIVTVGNPVIYQANLLDQNGAVTDVSGEVTVKLPVPSGMSGNMHVYLYNAATGTLTDMGAALQNGMLIFKTSQVNGCYAVSQISNCFITLDTHEYNMPSAGQYQIGVNLQGAEKRYMKVYSANPAVAGVIKLANGNYTATALSNGQAYIMFDVYDGKGNFLTHASTRINVVVSKKPHGDSKRQVGIFEPKS